MLLLIILHIVPVLSLAFFWIPNFTQVSNNKKYSQYKRLVGRSGGVESCDAQIWLIVWCVWVCDESYIGYLLSRFGIY